MTDPTGHAPTFESVTADVEVLLSTGKTATNEQAAHLQAVIERLLDPGRGSAGL